MTSGTVFARGASGGRVVICVGGRRACVGLQRWPSAIGRGQLDQPSVLRCTIVALNTGRAFHELTASRLKVVHHFGGL